MTGRWALLGMTRRWALLGMTRAVLPARPIGEAAQTSAPVASRPIDFSKPELQRMARLLAPRPKVNHDGAIIAHSEESVDAILKVIPTVPPSPLSGVCLRGLVRWGWRRRSARIGPRRRPRRKRRRRGLRRGAARRKRRSRKAPSWRRDPTHQRRRRRLPPAMALEPLRRRRDLSPSLRAGERTPPACRPPISLSYQHHSTPRERRLVRS